MLITAKFNESVPGTIVGLADITTQPMAEDSGNSNSSSRSLPTDTLTTSSNTTRRGEAQSEDLFIYIVLASMGVVSMLFIVYIAVKYCLHLLLLKKEQDC